MKLIKWIDSGPVAENEVEVDERGGLYSLEGPCGSGKSILLSALDDAINPDQRSTVPVRDGTPRAEVDVFGQVILRRSKNSRRLGHLEFETLAGRFSIADLIDPKIDKLDSRDAVRIKALLQLSGVKRADPALFYPLVGGAENFNKFVPSEALETEDLVKMASKIKGAFEKIARGLEDEYETTFAKAEALRISTDGTDLNAPYDETALKEVRDEAVREESRLRAASKAYADAVLNRDSSQEALEKHTKGAAHLPVDQARSSVVESGDLVSDIRDEIAELELKLEQAERKLAEADHIHELAIKTFQASEAHYSTIETLQSLVELPLPEPVMDLDIAVASEAVKKASEAENQGTLIRKARRDRENSVKLKSDAGIIKSQADLFREASHSTDSVLSEVVKTLNLPLSVSAGRLIITNSDRNSTGEELFEDLSKGEKCSLAIDIAIKAVSSSDAGGLLVIPQEMFEGLNPEIQTAIARKLEGSGVVAITARAVDGEGIKVRKVDPFPLI